MKETTSQRQQAKDTQQTQVANKHIDEMLHLKINKYTEEMPHLNSKRINNQGFSCYNSTNSVHTTQKMDRHSIVFLSERLPIWKRSLKAVRDVTHGDTGVGVQWCFLVTNVPIRCGCTIL